jgi:preprotein translocase subunit SecF
LIAGPAASASDAKAQPANAQRTIATRVAEALPGAQVRRVEVVGAKISQELFRNGLLATALALAAVLAYIWFRFLTSDRCAASRTKK